MCDALKAAEYLLNAAHENETPINNSMLQKILYIAQGYSLALNDRPLFPEDFIAWKCGPIIPVVYFTYNGHLTEALPPPSANPNIKPSEKDILDLVHEEWIKSGYDSLREKRVELSTFTRGSEPWLCTYDNGEGYERIISKPRIHKYFASEVVSPQLQG